MLALTAAACAGQSTAEVSAITSSSNLSDVNHATPGDGPQYGDTLAEWSGSGAVASDDSEASETDDPVGPVPGFATIEWDDLRVPGSSEDEIFARYTERLDAIDDSSPEANEIYDELRAELDAAGAQVNPALDGTPVQLAGFVAPLSYDGESITEFLLVPFFGACIHVPPPPPNQTILVTLDEGMSLDDSYGAVWVTGTLAVSAAETDLADASYAISGGASIVYDA